MARDARICALVTEVRLRQPRLGTRKLQRVLQAPLAKADIRVGRDRLFDVLRAARLLVKPHRAYHKTTNSHHRFRRHPNLLKEGPQQVVPTAAEQVWVADITYLPTTRQTVYLSLVTDAWSRKIVGYHVHDSLQTEQVSQALKMALRSRQTRLGGDNHFVRSCCLSVNRTSCLTLSTRQTLVHHSDRGIQYCSTYYQAIHQRHGLTCSMTDGYDCYQNAMAERINGILKSEFLLNRPTDLQQAARMVRESVRIYNRERPHQALKYKTPDEVHRASITLER